MPLMEIVLEQQFVGQQIINRFNYLASGTPAAVTLSFALAEAIGATPTSITLTADTPFRAVQQMQGAGVFFVQTLVKAVYLDDDFYTNPFFSNTHGEGSGGGESLSPTAAFGFRSNRVKQSIGRGYKRFVGVTETDVTNGGAISAAALATMAVVKDALSDTLTYDDEGNTLTFTPCIVQKEKYTTPSGKTAYKYYATELLQAPHIASGITWELYDKQRTQVSRQYGRGS